MELTKSNYQSDSGATYDRSRGTRVNKQKMPGSREPEGTNARGQIRVQLIGGHSSLDNRFYSQMTFSVSSCRRMRPKTERETYIVFTRKNERAGDVSPLESTCMKRALD